MIEAPLYSAAGKKSGNVELPSALFDGTVNEPVMHQAVKVFLANQRQGTHATKTRRWVTGGNQKPWRQKGTGRARQGTTRAPHWPGGGVVFGPHPRDYRQDIPRKQKLLARHSAFNARAREGAITVVEPLAFEGPKTARLAGMLEAMGLGGQKVLLLTNGVKTNVYLSGRNIPTVQVMPFSDAATYHVLWSTVVVVEQNALTGEADPVVEVSAEAPKAAKKKKPAAKKPAEKKARAAKPAAKKAAKPKAEKKPAARKPAAKKKGAK